MELSRVSRGSIVWRALRYLLGYALWSYLIVLVAQVALASLLPEPDDPSASWNVAAFAIAITYHVMMGLGFLLIPLLFFVSFLWRGRGSELRIAWVLAVLIIMLLFHTEAGVRILFQSWWILPR